jgi:hypothetical protein
MLEVFGIGRSEVHSAISRGDLHAEFPDKTWSGATTTPAAIRAWRRP